MSAVCVERQRVEDMRRSEPAAAACGIGGRSGGWKRSMPPCDRRRLLVAGLDAAGAAAERLRRCPLSLPAAATHRSYPTTRED